MKLVHTNWLGCCRDTSSGGTWTSVDGLLQNEVMKCKIKVRDSVDGAPIWSAGRRNEYGRLSVGLTVGQVGGVGARL